MSPGTMASTCRMLTSTVRRRSITAACLAANCSKRYRANTAGTAAQCSAVQFSECGMYHLKPERNILGKFLCSGTPQEITAQVLLKTSTRVEQSSTGRNKSRITSTHPPTRSPTTQPPTLPPTHPRTSTLAAATEDRVARAAATALPTGVLIAVAVTVSRSSPLHSCQHR